MQLTGFHCQRNLQVQQVLGRFSVRLELVVPAPDARRIFRPGVFFFPIERVKMTDVSRRGARKRACGRFLKHLRQGSSVRAAADAAGVPRSSLYKWRQTLPEFAAAWRAVPGRRAPPARPSKAPALAPQWIEIPGQGRRHVSTIGRQTGGPRNGPQNGPRPALAD
ncbi:MAG: hypothetical protein EXR12_10360 [Rhodospirillaceae bacterium]|nr:hypothetical protein [Rhodospirillaceae bacterium]